MRIIQENIGLYYLNFRFKRVPMPLCSLEKLQKLQLRFSIKESLTSNMIKLNKKKLIKLT